MTYLSTLVQTIPPATKPEYSSTTLSPALVEILRSYSQEINLSAAQQTALSKLEDPNLAFIVTGQQVGLYLSPLLVLSKLVSAIALADTLSKRDGRNYLPLFWLQSEDHDLAEISTAKLPLRPASDSGQSNAFSTALSLHGALDWGQDVALADNRVSVADLRFTDDITTLNEQLCALLERTPHFDALKDAIFNAYQPGASPVDAFASLLAQVFADYPVLFFHPKLPGVASLTAPIYRQTLTHWSAASTALSTQAKKLQSIDQEPPVYVREDSPLFFLEIGPAKERFRLSWEEESEHWSVIGAPQTLSATELQRIVEQEPHRLSSSALLRPLIQNTLFPTAAYMAGPGEVAYHTQVATVAEALSLPYSPALKRFHFKFIDAKSQSLMQQLGLDSAALSKDAESLRSELLNRSAHAWDTPSTVQEYVTSELDRLFSYLDEQRSKVDPTLEGPLSKTRGKTEQAFNAFLSRYEAAIKKQQQIEFDRLDRLLHALLPEGQEQERYFSAIYFLAQIGTPLVRKMLDATFTAETSTVEITL